jgi:hypothetical protein
MSPYRLAAFLALAASSTHSFAADPKAEAIASHLRANLQVVRLVPWFPGMHAVRSNVETNEQPSILWTDDKGQVVAGSLSEHTCLKLRTYRVKRQESFSQGESGSLWYSTCQWASNYELRSTVEIKTLQATPAK